MTEPWGTPTSREHEEKKEVEDGSDRKLSKFKPVKTNKWREWSKYCRKIKEQEENKRDVKRFNNEEDIYPFARVSFSSKIDVNFALYIVGREWLDKI